MILIHICPDILTLNSLMQQAFPFLQTVATSNQQQQQKGRVGKYSIISSLKKGSPSSEAYVNRMSK